MTLPNSDGVSAAVLDQWLRLLPEHPDLGVELIRRWSESHRRYHDLRHLAESLTALRQLNATEDEHLAIWFHDAVFAGRPGFDEHASAELAFDLLGQAGLSLRRRETVARLVLVTEHHSPAAARADDCRVSDADLAILAAAPRRYQESVADLRAEYDHLDDGPWFRWRLVAVGALLSRPRLFHTPEARSWEVPARHNLESEREVLRNLAGTDPE